MLDAAPMGIIAISDIGRARVFYEGVRGRDIAAEIAAEIAGLTAKGMHFERYDFFGDSQSPEGIWTSPGGAKVAWFKDPDGNLLSLSQHVG